MVRVRYMSSTPERVEEERSSTEKIVYLLVIYSCMAKIMNRSTTCRLAFILISAKIL
jgi:hypothetical protein